ncbi:hypothetical protein ACWGR3_30605, partial [Streptomyces albidoflavus]
AVPFFSTYGNGTADYQYVKRVMFYEGDRVVPGFSGADPDDADYEYEWEESAHGSPSLRIPKQAQPSPDALIWEAGQSAWDFLSPLVQASGLRLVCDEQRVWTLRNEDYTSSATPLDVAWGENLRDGADVIDRDSERWGDAAVTIYTWTDRNGIPQRAVDQYSSVEHPTLVLRYEKDTAYPGPGFSEYAVRRAQTRGREITATIDADWTAKADQPITAHTHGAPVENGRTISVQFDSESNDMTVTTRTET